MCGCEGEGDYYVTVSIQARQDLEVQLIIIAHPLQSINHQTSRPCSSEEQKPLHLKHTQLQPSTHRLTAMSLEHNAEVTYSSERAQVCGCVIKLVWGVAEQRKQALDFGANAEWHELTLVTLG